MRELRLLIEKIVAEKVVVTTIGKVISVNKEALTCAVKATGTGEEYFDVRLLGVSDQVEKPTIYFPKIDSFVGIMPLFNSRNIMAVVLVTEIDEVFLNGNEFGGLVKVEELVTRLNLVEGKLNNLINKWNSFCTNYIPGSPTTVGLPATLTTEIETEIEETVVSDIENEVIKHG